MSRQEKPSDACVSSVKTEGLEPLSKIQARRIVMNRKVRRDLLNSATRTWNLRLGIELSCNITQHYNRGACHRALQETLSNLRGLETTSK